MLRLAPISLACLALGCASAAPAPPVKPEGPVPAKLAVEAPAGSDVYVDGVLVGVAPLEAPVDADPGKHAVQVTLNGHEPFARSVVLTRGRTDTLVVDLDETDQRKGAWASIGVGAASLTAGIILGVLSVVEHRESRDILDEDEDGSGLNAEAQARYDDAVDARDRYRIGSGVAAGVGLGLFVVGAVLFAFDAPLAPGEIAVLPSVSPEFAGAAARLSFE